jgi:hypothetical protein
VEAGPTPPGATSRLVDAVLDQIHVPAGTALEMTFPTGEAEMLEQIRHRCGVEPAADAGDAGGDVLRRC